MMRNVLGVVVVLGGVAGIYFAFFPTPYCNRSINLICGLLLLLFGALLFFKKVGK